MALTYKVRPKRGVKSTVKNTQLLVSNRIHNLARELSHRGDYQ